MNFEVCYGMSVVLLANMKFNVKLKDWFVVFRQNEFENNIVAEFIGGLKNNEWVNRPFIFSS